MTPEQKKEKERWNSLTPAQKGLETKAKNAAAAAAEIAKKADKPADKPADKTVEKAKKGFVNPLAKGVSYDDFIKSIPKGKSIGAYCKGKLTESEIDWISREVESHKKNKKNK